MYLRAAPHIQTHTHIDLPNKIQRNCFVAINCCMWNEKKTYKYIRTCIQVVGSKRYIRSIIYTRICPDEKKNSTHSNWYTGSCCNMRQLVCVCYVRGQIDFSFDARFILFQYQTHSRSVIVFCVSTYIIRILEIRINNHIEKNIGSTGDAREKN